MVSNLPWGHTLTNRIVDANGRTVADCRFAADQGAKIVKAVNSHAKLVTALKSFPKTDNPNGDGDCKHGEEWDLCDACEFEWKKAVAEWIQIRNEALREAGEL